MRKLAILALVTLAAAPLYAERAQSYITYDDGGTVVRQSDDGRQIDARVNIPLFPGDEVTTARRGRSEVRLSDEGHLELQTRGWLLLQGAFVVPMRVRLQAFVA